MNITGVNPELLAFFKALVDAERLKIVGSLAQEAQTIPELANTLGLDPNRVNRHVRLLRESDLVHAHPGANGEAFALNTRRLESLARQHLAGLRPQHPLSEGEFDESERQIIQNYTRPDGSLKALPSKNTALPIIIAILHYVASAFEREMEYTEQEVNDMLERFHPDTASLRRYLVDTKIMARARDGSSYWKVEEH